jgi:hypothetical protein
LVCEAPDSSEVTNLQELTQEQDVVSKTEHIANCHDFPRRLSGIDDRLTLGVSTRERLLNEGCHSGLQTGESNAHMGIVWGSNHGTIDSTKHVLHAGNDNGGNTIPAGKLLGSLVHGLNEGNHLHLLGSESRREMRAPRDHASTYQG